jgi:hypothetical protein
METKKEGEVPWQSKIEEPFSESVNGIGPIRRYLVLHPHTEGRIVIIILSHQYHIVPQFYFRLDNIGDTIDHR